MVIGRAKDLTLGTCVLESVTPDLGMATPTEGTGFQVGDAVRLIGVPTPAPPPAAEPPK